MFNVHRLQRRLEKFCAVSKNLKLISGESLIDFFFVLLPLLSRVSHRVREFKFCCSVKKGHSKMQAMMINFIKSSKFSLETGKARVVIQKN